MKTIEEVREMAQEVALDEIETYATKLARITPLLLHLYEVGCLAEPSLWTEKECEMYEHAHRAVQRALEEM